MIKQYYKVLLVFPVFLGISFVSDASQYFNVKCDVELYGGHRVIQYAELKSKNDIPSYQQHLMTRKIYKEGKRFAVYKVHECIDEKLIFSDKSAVEVEKQQAQ